MRIGDSSLPSVLLTAALAAVLSVAVALSTRGSDAAPLTAADAFQTWESPPVLVVVDGNSPSDVAVGQPIAESLSGEVLAVTGDGLTAAMTTELSYTRPRQVLVLGGPVAVTEATASALQQYTSRPVTRLAGADRFATAAMVAKSQFNGRARRVRIVAGDQARIGPTAPDQEAAGTPVLLVERNRIPPSVVAALHHLHPQSIDVVGGPSEISDGVLQQLRAFTPGQVERKP